RGSAVLQREHQALFALLFMEPMEYGFVYSVTSCTFPFAIGKTGQEVSLQVASDLVRELNYKCTSDRFDFLSSRQIYTPSQSKAAMGSVCRLLFAIASSEGRQGGKNMNRKWQGLLRSGRDARIFLLAVLLAPLVVVGTAVAQNTAYGTGAL